MSPRYIFNTAGEYVAFVLGGNLFSPDGEWLGFLAKGNEVYQKDGRFAGYLLSDDRIARRRDELPRLPRQPPVPPLRPLRPMVPLRRMKMPPLPAPYQDVFEYPMLRSGSLLPLETGPTLERLEGAKILAADGQYLGTVSRNPYVADSLANDFNPYGNRFNPNSLFNAYGPYGNPYSPLSPFNLYTQTPPRLVINEETIGYLTLNPLVANRISPHDLFAWLGKSR